MVRVKTDFPLFACIVVMVCAGLVILYSASSVMAQLKYNANYYFFVRQASWAVVSFAALWLLKKCDYRQLNNSVWAFTAMGVVLALLILVYFLDWHTHRWLRLGVLSLQPAEFAKPALAIFLAFFVTQRAPLINNRYTIRSAALSLGLLAGVVVIADLGTAVVLVATGAVVFYVAGLQKRYFLAAAGLTVLFVVAAVLSKPYRVQRIVGYLDPSYSKLELIGLKDTVKSYAERSNGSRDPSYQVRQSKIAVGSGGIAGLGLMHGKQKLFYLPEAHTDFIFAVVCEELGLWGASGILIGFLIILWHGLRVYWNEGDDFGKNLALAVTASIVIQAFVNMSVVLDMAPTKGIPLPMISYGGSSLLSTLVSLGLLLSVSDRAG